MPAPEIGQAKAKAAIVESPVVQVEGSADQQAGDANTEATPPSKSEATPPAATSEKTPPAAAPNDGSVSLAELPDEDLLALCASQNVQVPKGADRDQLIASLKAKGIERVMLPPKA